MDTTIAFCISFVVTAAIWHLVLRSQSHRTKNDALSSFRQELGHAHEAVKKLRRAGDPNLTDEEAEDRLNWRNKKPRR